jgi:hypothetical protein
MCDDPVDYFGQLCLECDPEQVGYQPDGFDQLMAAERRVLEDAQDPEIVR